MTYPGETARESRTTASSVAYTAVTVSIGGDEARIHIPNDRLDVAPVNGNLCIVMHGHNGAATIIDGNVASTRDELIDLGYVVASAYAAGNAWANNAAQNAYLALHDFCRDYVVTPQHVVLHGSSMGGLTAAVMYANDVIPNIRAAAIIDPAVSLQYAFGKEPYKSAIKTAYGFTNDADYATATAGHDALLIPGALYSGKRFQVFASYDDTSIEQEFNADLFISAFTGYAFLDFVQCTGAHVAASHYQPAETVPFYQSAISPVAWVEPVVIPPGMGLVRLYTVLGGVPVPVTG